MSTTSAALHPAHGEGRSHASSGTASRSRVNGVLRRSKREAARFRAAGVKAGVSDLFLPWPRGGYHGLWIEMKALDGRPSLEQKVFIRDMKAAGYAAVFCFGAEEAEAVITRYLAGKAVEE